MQEVERELLYHDSLGGIVSCLALAVATANLNARIRSRGLSAREIWTQRDQFSNQQLPLQDQDIIMRQHERIANHLHSEKSKASKSQEPACRPSSPRGFNLPLFLSQLVENPGSISSG